MRVQLDDKFVITSDENNFILKEGNNAVGYYGNLEQLFDAYLNKSLMKSDATELSELLIEFRTIKRYIQSILNLLNLKGMWD